MEAGMIQITPQMRILLAVEPVGFRRGIDGLAALCRQALGSDPQTGALFVFRSRRGQVIIDESTRRWTLTACLGTIAPDARDES
jgi:hypothetical protein